MKMKLILLLCLVGASQALASIENEPVKVTHKNSGPKYEFDEVERTRLAQSQAEEAANQVLPPRPLPPAQPEEGGAESEAPTMGHIAIRRIFLVPISAGGPQQPDEPSYLSRSSIWPLFAQPRPQHHPHLLGEDEASRPPPAQDESMWQSPSGQQGQQERERPTQGGAMLIDPYQMMAEMMRQMLNPMLANPATFLNDLAKEANNSETNKPTDSIKPAESSATELEKPQLEKGQRNETKEEIVEIEGKKYLRKTVISRHVGDNIIFMTRRLIFTPLNETDSTEVNQQTTTTTTTTLAPPTAAASTERESSDSSSEKPPVAPEQEAATTTQTPTNSAGSSESGATAKTAESEPTTSATPAVQEGSSQPSTTPLDSSNSNTNKESASTLDVIRRAATATN